MLTDIMDQGLSYNTSYYGLFNFLLGFGISTKVVLLLDVAVGGVILLAAAAWMFRKKLDNDWLLWYAVTAVVSVMWFYKQSHDYIILALPAIAIFCLPQPARMGQYPDFAGGCHCLCGTQSLHPAVRPAERCGFALG